MHGVIENGELLGDRVEVKHSDEYVAVNDERRAEAEEPAAPVQPPHRDGRRASVNSALGPSRDCC